MWRPSVLSIFCLVAVNNVLLATSAKSSLGTTVPTCDIKAADVNTCVKNAANKIIPRLTKGVRELDLPPADPLYIDKMDFGQESGSVYFKLLLSDTVHSGISGAIVQKAEVDFDQNRIHFDVLVPKYTLLGNYEGKGRILLLPLAGAGVANFTFTDLKIEFTFYGTRKVIKGEEYLVMDKMDTVMHFAPGKNSLDMKRTNGNGDALLGGTARDFLHKNADEVFNGMKGTLENLYSEILLKLVRRTFDKVPLSKLFKNW